MSFDLIQEIQQKNNDLSKSVKELRKSGTKRAETERDYKVLLNKECLKLRDSGMAVGLISVVVYGIKEVAEARFERDIADTVYKANIEAVNTIKLQLRLLDSQLSREWGTNE